MPAHPRAAPAGPAPALGALYGALFLVAGILLPYWPVWLASRGLDAGRIAAVLALGLMVRIVAAPMVAYAVDRRGERRRPLLALSLLSLVLYASFFLYDDFLSIVFGSVLVAATFPSMVPITDSLALRVCAERGLDYGRVRLWGSLAFIAAAYLGGALLGRFGPDAVLACVLVGCALSGLAVRRLPDDRGVPEAAARPIAAGAALRLLGQPRFVLFLLGASAIQASHGVYYGFGTLHWQRLGYGDSLIGSLWALGVAAEVALFAVSGRAVARFGPVGLILLGGAGGVLRWAVTGFDPPLAMLAAMQALHALTYGATHLGSMHFIARTVPPGLSATAQSLLSALASGVVLAGATAVSGWLYAAWGGHAYLAMAALAGLGAILVLPLARRGGDG